MVETHKKPIELTDIEISLMSCSSLSYEAARWLYDEYLQSNLKVTDLEGEFGELSKLIDSLNRDIDNHEKEVDRLDDDILKLNNKIDRLENDIRELNKEVELLNHAII